MEIKSINRNYYSFKFRRKNKFNKLFYERLLEESKFHEMKKMVIPYCEDKLHVIATYLFIFQYVIPILMLFLLLLLNFHFYYFIGLFFSFTVFKILQKKWKKTTTIYKLEVSAIDTFINEKYDTNITTDFDELGIYYLNFL